MAGTQDYGPFLLRYEATRIGPSFCEFGQGAMDKRNGDGAFTDCGSHAFDTAAANVTHGEDARKRGFEQMG